MKALAVIAWALPPAATDTTTTPVANWPIASWNWRALNVRVAATIQRGGVKYPRAA